MTVYRRALAMMEAQLGDEIVALDSAGGNCFGFNSVASSVWNLLSEPRSFEELKHGLLKEYDVGEEECASELRALLSDMSTRGLLSAS